MTASSDVFPKLLILGVALAGLWLLLDKASGPSGAGEAPEWTGIRLDEIPDEIGIAPVITTPEPAIPSAVNGPMQTVSEDTGPQLNEQNSEAIRLLNEKRYAEAEDLFRKCLAERPEELAFAANLAECLVRRAVAEFDTQPEPSIEALLEAIRLAPDRGDLIVLRDRWTKILAAQEGFAEDQSLHFVLQYDGARSELLSRGYLDVLQDLEAAYQDYGEFFDHFPVEKRGSKFAVVLYDREAFDSVTGIGEWAGGAFDGTIRIPVRNFQRDRNRIRGVLRHELVHAFIQEVGGRKVPGWLNEGLAQYLSPEGDGAQASEVRNALSRMRGQEPLDFATLTGTLAALTDTKMIRLAYDQSLGLTHWIGFHYGERTLVAMVTAGNRGISPAQAFEEQIHFGLSAAMQDFVDSL